MLDANDYADPFGLRPAERCLVPQHWTAVTPLEDAITAPLGGSSIAVEVVVNNGRWLVQCPDCPGAQLAASEDPRFMCVECANVGVGGLWRPVNWPKAHAEISALLEVRTRDIQNWLPGETVMQLREENELLARAYRLGPQTADPEGNPFHEHWQGHTHRWPKKPDATGMLTCQECALTLPAETVLSGGGA